MTSLKKAYCYGETCCILAEEATTRKGFECKESTLSDMIPCLKSPSAYVTGFARGLIHASSFSTSRRYNLA